MNTALNPALVPFVKNTVRPIRIMLILLAGMIGLICAMTGYYSYGQLVSEEKYADPTIVLSAFVFFTLVLAFLIWRINYLAKPENSFIGKLLTVKKDKVKRIFRWSIQLTLVAGAGKLGKPSQLIIISTRENPNMAKVPRILFKNAEEADHVMGLLQKEFNGQAVSFE